VRVFTPYNRINIKSYSSDRFTDRYFVTTCSKLPG